MWLSLPVDYRLDHSRHLGCTQHHILCKLPFLALEAEAEEEEEEEILIPAVWTNNLLRLQHHSWPWGRLGKTPAVQMPRQGQAQAAQDKPIRTVSALPGGIEVDAEVSLYLWLYYQPKEAKLHEMIPQYFGWGGTLRSLSSPTSCTVL